jgi:hypothetical protein
LAYLFLLHELGVWAIVHHILAKDWSGQRAVDFFGAEILEFSIEDKVVSLGSKVDSHLLAQQDKREDIPVLVYNQHRLGDWGEAQFTFSRHRLKKAMGSIP